MVQFEEKTRNKSELQVEVLQFEEKDKKREEVTR